MFADLHQEPVLLEAEYSQSRYELACAAVSGPRGMDSCAPGADWKADFKREILEVKGQMCELMQEVMKELRLVSPAAQPNYAQLKHARLQPQKTPRWRWGHSSPNRWDTEGRPLCWQCQQSGRIARYCKENVLPQEDLN